MAKGRWPRKTFTTWLGDPEPTRPLCSIFQVGLPRHHTQNVQHPAFPYFHFTQPAGPPLPGDDRYSHNAGAAFVTHGQLLGIADRRSHFGDWSLNTSESRGFVGIPCGEEKTWVGWGRQHCRIAINVTEFCQSRLYACSSKVVGNAVQQT